MATGVAGFAAITNKAGDLLVFFATALVVLGVAVEIAKPVFLSGNKGAPRRFACAAIVQCAACAQAVGAVLGDHVGTASGRAGKQHFGHGGYTAVQVGGLQGLPLTTVGLHFHHGEAVNGKFLVHFTGRAGQAGLAAVGVDKERAELFVGGGFVVHGQHAAGGAVGTGAAIGIQSEPLHAVMVVTGTVFPLGVTAIVFEGCYIAAQRVAQGIEHLHVIAGGDHHLVGQALGHGLEA